MLSQERPLRSGALDLRQVKDVVRALDTLLTEVAWLYETVNTVRDETTSLIERHINVKSFEMNRLLRLLGMHVMGHPWPVTLGQVAFVVAMATAMSGFAVKGWLT